MGTGLTLKWTFVTFAFILFFHALSMMMVKMLTSQEFKEDGNTFNKLMHVVQNIHCSFPYKDWDEDEGKSATKEVFRERFHNTENEMIWSQLLNIGVSMIMLVPLWITGQLEQIIMLLSISSVHITTSRRGTSCWPAPSGPS